MILTTGRVCNIRSLQRDGWEVIDITVKSAKGAYRCFAPTWDIVMGHKRGKISDDEYTATYLDMMRDSYRKHRKVWHAVASKPGKVALVCYCKKGAFCHRHILADCIEKVCNRLGVECTRVEE